MTFMHEYIKVSLFGLFCGIGIMGTCIIVVRSAVLIAWLTGGL